ncbi:DUF421 domain-containing protein [Wukongibacter sp. M2B1]|uniref:DUF421 domain-containing protein n=1 Tax=Wukongibacter sp. M2B1 TaxID=3088895 RepID=UPI003D7B9D2C
MEGILNSVENLSLLGFIARTFIVGLILYCASRFLPHRSGGQYAGFDFTFFWMMGGLIAAPLFDSKISFLSTIVSIITIYLTHYIISYLGVKSRFFARIVYGKEEILISDGKIHKKNMLRSLFPVELLLSQLREVDVQNIKEIHTAILETNGRVSVLKKSDYMPVTPIDLKIPVPENRLPIILINDGKVLEKNLRSIGYDRQWLSEELEKQGVTDIKSLYLVTIDGAGKIYYSLEK